MTAAEGNGMIYFILSSEHESSLKALQDDPDAPNIGFLRYAEIFKKESLPVGTYIFTCLSTLGPKRRVAGARLYRRLKEAGCRVFNDPARVKLRHSILRALYREGINPFNVYSVESEERPQRFPVFLRMSHGSHAALTDLISNQESLENAVEAAIACGYPRETLLIVEYAGQPIRDGVFRKSSVYRIGERFIPDIWWYGKSWEVKLDIDGLADDELYKEELEVIRENRYPEEVSRAFELANIDHGRLDFGFIDGRICIYEINLLPAFHGPRDHRVPERVESLKLRWGRLLSAFHEIDTKEDSPEKFVEVGGTSLEALKEAQTVFPALRPTLMTIGLEYERRGDLAAALEAMESAVAADPNDLKARAHRKRLSQIINPTDAAEADAASRAVSTAPSFAWLRRLFKPRSE